MIPMQDKKGKLQEYQERYHFWTDKRISQLSFQNNLFLAIGIAILGYFWKERDSVYTQLIINSSLSIDPKIVFFFIGMMMILYSIVTGLLLAISRLIDLRLTSNVLLTRKRALQNEVAIDDKLLAQNSFFKSFHSLWVVFWNYDDFVLARSEINPDNSSFQPKFRKLRQASRDIGNFLWILVKNQIVSLLLSLVLFIVVLIIK